MSTVLPHLDVAESVGVDVHEGAVPSLCAFAKDAQNLVDAKDGAMVLGQRAIDHFRRMFCFGFDGKEDIENRRTYLSRELKPIVTSLGLKLLLAERAHGSSMAGVSKELGYGIG